LSGFIAVRRYAGGFHADTRGKCLTVSLILVVAALTRIEMMSEIIAKVITYDNACFNGYYLV